MVIRNDYLWYGTPERTVPYRCINLLDMDFLLQESEPEGKSVLSV
ncbi:hypothetical protein [Xenorhabdus beddingii]|nr:hypothetical protein [Xenorhabdus beddingii]